jgi:hypothetical protein
MGIKQQEFYEGAALHLLARTQEISGIFFDSPFFILNGRLLVLLKYSTKNGSRWDFSFSVNEQERLHQKAAKFEAKIGLICGSDGVASFDYDEYLTIASTRPTPIYIACSRNQSGFYVIGGPDGMLGRAIVPSQWQKVLTPKATA